MEPLPQMKPESEEEGMKDSALALALAPAPVLENKKKKKKKKKKKEEEEDKEEEEEKKDLKALIHGHAIFFDRLVELIPPRFYLPHDDGTGKVWFHGLSKGAKASFKKQSRENLKMARRQRLEASPSSSSVSTLELLKKSVVDKKSRVGGEGEPDAAPPAVAFDGEQNHDGSVTYEELRQRLHRRIGELRGNRNTRDPVAGVKKVKGGRNQQKNQKRGDLGKGERGRNAGSAEKKPTEKAAGESVAEFAFGQVKIGGEQVGKKGKKRKGSKAQELERAKRLKQAMDDPEKGARVSKKHSWSAALNRAAGVKVHDDPKLLKQSIKKEKKRQQKSSKKWNERKEVIEKNKAAKQQTRSEHIADRARDKKMRRIAKREKKLMRPGFEGRKDGFINETST